jgi:hypothetical protein
VIRRRSVVGLQVVQQAPSNFLGVVLDHSD